MCSHSECRFLKLCRELLDVSDAWLMLQDESDEMLSRGFKDQIYDVYRYLPPELQVINVTRFVYFCKFGSS